MRLTRRHFTASVLAGTLVGIRKKLSAQTYDAIVVGVEHGPIVSNSGSSTNPNSNTIENYTTLPPSTTPASALQGLSVQYLDVQTQEGTSTIIDQPLLAPSDRISGITYLADGSLLVVIYGNAASANGAAPPRLVRLSGTSSTVLPVSGLAVNQGLDSVRLLSNGSVIGMVTHKDGTGPAQIVQVNPTTGAVSFPNLVSLPPNRRFSCLAEAPDGTLYTSVFRDNTTTELWSLNLTQKTAIFLIELTTASPCSNNLCAGFDDMPGIISWYHGIQSLIVTSTGQLLAQCNLEYHLPDSLYAIDVDTGFMTQLVATFPVARSALSPGIIGLV
jgi:hypothetical protein